MMSRLPTSALLLLLSAGCALLPVRRNHLVRLSFVPDPSGDYAVGPEDGAAVFHTDGLVVKVRYLSKQDLNAEYGEKSEGRVNVNPFTYGTKIDNDLGYVPDRFTVFEIDINNIGLPKMQLDPEKAILLTDRGDRLPSWGIDKGEAADTFEEYYRARRGFGGNDENWYRERMGIVERALIPRDTPLFKGQRQRGIVVFGLLHEKVREVRLRLSDLIIGFDGYDLPKETMDLDFPFTVEVRLETAS